MKLADFGLSKIIKSSRKERTTYDRSDALKLSEDAYNKILQFLPLKINTATHPKQNVVTILLVCSDVASDTQTTLRSLGFDVLTAKTNDDVVSVLRSNNDVEAIFVDLMDETSESRSQQCSSDGTGACILNEFCAHLYNSIPVFVVCRCDEATRNRIIAIGARYCFQKPLDINECSAVMNQSSSENPLPRLALSTLHSTNNSATIDGDKSLYSTSREFSSQHISTSTSPSVFNSLKDDVIHDSIHIEEDFHLARRQSLQDEHVNSFERDYQDHSAVGTLHFIAPEVIKVQKYGKSVDWWACGVTFYECLVRSHLFRGDDKQEVFDNILQGPIDLSLLQEFGQPIVDLVSGLLNRDIKYRLGTQGTERIKSHVFFKSVSWQTISFSDPAYKPAQFVSKKLDLKDKVLFYGPVDNQLEVAELNAKSSLAAKNIQSLKRFQTNQKRAHKSKRGIDRSNAKHNVNYAMSAAAQTKRKLLVSGELSLQTRNNLIKSGVNNSKQKRESSWSNLMSSDSFHFSVDDEDSVEDEKEGDDTSVRQF